LAKVQATPVISSAGAVIAWVQPFGYFAFARLTNSLV